ncbi:MAG: carboxypeptidase-like regulatory domain-containing protein, partial [Balneolaceae bacterium]
MRRFVFSIIFFGFTFSLLQEPVSAQNVVSSLIEGKVTNSETGMPLRGAHVFISGTTIGTATNAAGRYRLRGIPPGNQRLAISMIGYNRVTIDTLIHSGSTNEINIKMKPAVYELSPLFVGNLDKKWERRLDRFYDLFIGESERADSVKI